MPLLVRRFERQRWDHDVRNDASIPHVTADAITDLKTKGNTLSVWYAESEAELDNAVLAIAGTLNQIDSIDVIALDMSDLKLAGLVLQEDVGATKIKGFDKRHRNIVELDYASLGVVARVMIDRLIEYDQKKKTTRITALQIQHMLEDAVSSSLLDWDDLPKDIRQKIRQPSSSIVR